MSTQLSLLPQQGLYQSPPLVPQYTAPSGSGASRLGKILYPAADPIPYRLCGIYWLITSHSTTRWRYCMDNSPLQPHRLYFSQVCRRYHLFSRGCTTWLYVQVTPNCVGCWPIAIWSFGKHWGMGAMGGRNMIELSVGRRQSIRPYVLVPSLQAATLLGNRGASGTCCSIWMEPDHQTKIFITR